ncbi:5-oxoprolinase subunit B family protein [Microtetraspora malaysiensis]|uniref:5-oxoprolinase subunit B family protein n=1 Tax=Microtetraspora malaysiensis TaxID=161358 RepID=UPI003D936909
MTAHELRPVGERGLIIELGDNDLVHRYAEAVRQRCDLQDIVAGHTTVMITWTPPQTRDQVLQRLRGIDPLAIDPPDRPTLVVPVRYDGPDLDYVAQSTGLSPAEVIQRHLNGTYRVAFIGFAPGFGYLIGGDPLLRVPRRREPRTRVPAGSVAMAGEYTAIYPSASPGGWQLIGTTDLPLFDERQDPPALLHPGTPVTFKQVRT